MKTARDAEQQLQATVGADFRVYHLLPSADDEPGHVVGADG